MIKHFGRWVIVLLIALTAGGWYLERTLDHAIITQALWVIYVAAPVVSLLAMERQRGARPGVLSILATLGAALVIAWILLGLDARWWIKGLLFIVLSTPLTSIANARFRADVMRAQQRRDAHATQLAEAALAGAPVERFALYLRPFVSTDRLIAQPLPSDTEVPVHLDVETVLARGFRTTVPIIALGTTGDTMEGAARVMVSDDHWREMVEALARRAEFIVMVPLSRPGTMWELEWLKQSDLLKKVLFIMPETLYETPGGVVSTQEQSDRVFEAGVQFYEASVHMLDLPKEWFEAVRAARNFGLEFPPLAAVGALFTMNPATGKVKDILPLALSMVTRRVHYLRTSVARLGLLPVSKAPGDFSKEFVKAMIWGGRTLEFAFMRAGDGYAAWGDTDTAISLMQRAVEAGQPRPKFSTEYIHALPALMEERVQVGDTRAAANYAAFTRRVCADAGLAALTTDETLRQIDSLCRMEANPQ
ncbi:MAG: hypothetical protein HYR56_07810 [Acidobacteria bacterium]|nr:hypothetical protein [Acidobacteriota bacterium]MBI3425350.1 hypothetical protein [Acidobacteriota bacterium]